VTANSLFLLPRLRRNTRGVTPVVGTILVVAVTIVLGTVLYLLVTNALVPPPTPPPAVGFVSGDWNGGTYTASVESEAYTSTIELAAISYKVEDAFGNLFFAGKSGDSATAGGITLTVQYHDDNGDDRISAKDEVTVTVDPPAAGSQAVSGGVLRLVYKGGVIASHSIA
jgi:flagellin-like protein